MAGRFTLTHAGPPGSCRVQVTTDSSTWTEMNSVTNVVGSAAFTEDLADQRPRSFYRMKLEP